MIKAPTAIKSDCAKEKSLKQTKIWNLWTSAVIKRSRDEFILLGSFPLKVLAISPCVLLFSIPSNISCFFNLRNDGTVTNSNWALRPNLTSERKRKTCFLLYIFFCIKSCGKSIFHSYRTHTKFWSISKTNQVRRAMANEIWKNQNATQVTRLCNSSLVIVLNHLNAFLAKPRWKLMQNI